MADILIKNMEMPPHCAYDDKDGNAKLCFMFKYCLEHGYNKINNCPLVELPSHGRLVQDTDVKEILRSGVSLDCDADRDYVCELIDELPTIVEASNGSDN